jgi:hypothetical protein
MLLPGEDAGPQLSLPHCPDTALGENPHGPHCSSFFERERVPYLAQRLQTCGVEMCLGCGEATDLD